MFGILNAFLSVAVFAAVDLDKQFEKTKIQVGNQVIEAYVADSEEKRNQGLMYVEKLAENTGMLFAFEEERQLSFWMKNTWIPLAIGYFDRSGTLVDIQEMKVVSSVLNNYEQPTYPSKTSAQYALEMNTGWYGRHKIKTGSRLKVLSNPKSELLRKSPLVGKTAARQ